MPEKARGSYSHTAKHTRDPLEGTGSRDDVDDGAVRRLYLGWSAEQLRAEQ